MNIKLFSLSVSLVTTSALLVSCTLPPGYTLPDVTIESDWNNHGASIAQGDNAQVNITWWRQFNDPTLNSLVEEAYSENLGLRVAALRILESRALLGLVKGGLLPPKSGCQRTAASQWPGREWPRPVYQQRLHRIRCCLGTGFLGEVSRFGLHFGSQPIGRLSRL